MRRSVRRHERESWKDRALARDFWVFQLGQVVSVIGDSCGAIAIAWWILEKTGSAAAMSAVLGPALFVRVLLLPLVGPFVDRLPRKWLVFFSDFWRGGLAFALCLVTHLDMFSLPLLSSLLALGAAGSALFSSASESLIPQLVSNRQIPEAMRRTEILDAVGAAVGGIVGGLSVSFIGVTGALFLDGLSFLIAAVATFSVRVGTCPTHADLRAAQSLRSWRQDLVNGFLFVLRAPSLVGLAFVSLLLNFALVPLVILLPVLVKTGHAMPPWFLGAFESSMAVGTVAGALAIAGFERWLTRDRVLVGGLITVGAALFVLPRVEGLAPSLGSLFFIGVGGSLASVVLASRIAIAVPNHYRGRLCSNMAFVGHLVAPIGLVVSGNLAEAKGIEASLSFLGAVTILLGPTLFAVPIFSRFLRARCEPGTRVLKTNFMSRI